MPDDLRTIVQRMIDAGEPEDAIASVIRHVKGTTPAPPADPNAHVTMQDLASQGPSAMRATAGQGFKETARFAGEHPGQAGALLAGAAVAPFTGGLSLAPAMLAEGAAGFGGALAGHGVKGAVTGTMPDAKEALTDAAKQGALGAAGEGIGGAITAGLQRAAPYLAKGVLKVSKGLQKEYGLGDIIDTFLKERIPVGQSAQAGAKVAESAGQADRLIADAQAAGAAPVSVREVAQDVRPVRDTAQLRARLGKPNETPAIAQRMKAMYRENPGGIPLTDAQDLKREAQKLSGRTFRAIDRGADVNDIQALTDKSVATGLRKGIEARVPDVVPVNQRTQKLMGLEHALSDAESRSPGFMGTNPVTWMGAVAPGAGSHAAFGLDAASRFPTAMALRNALIAALGGSPEPPQ